MFGIIIFGARPVERQVGTGRFHCPACQVDAACSHHEVRQYATLFFVPVVSYGSAQEFVRCERCGSEYAASVLGAARAQDSAVPVPPTWKCDHCGNTNPADHSRCLACEQPQAALHDRT